LVITFFLKHSGKEISVSIKNIMFADRGCFHPDIDILPDPKDA